MASTSFSRIVSKVCSKNMRSPTFGKTRAPAPQLARTCSLFLAHGRDLTFPSWVPGLGENFCPTAISGKTNTRSAARFENSNFHMPWQGPDCSVPCPRLGRTLWYTLSFFKKMVHVSKPVGTCKIWLAYGHDLTFAFCLQGLFENNCFHSQL